MALYVSTIFISILMIVATALFWKVSHKQRVGSYIAAFVFVFIGYAFADFLAYELTSNLNAMQHSITTTTVLQILTLLQVSVTETYIMAGILFVFTVIESYFFYTAYNMSKVLVPEVQEEVTKLMIPKIRYMSTFLIGYPLKILVILIITGFWAGLHFPGSVVIHAFLSLMFSVPISLYVITKTQSMYPLIIPWWLWDCILLLWL